MAYITINGDNYIVTTSEGVATARAALRRAGRESTTVHPGMPDFSRDSKGPTYTLHIDPAVGVDGVGYWATNNQTIS